MISSAVTSKSGRVSTKAQGVSPHFSSGLATTAASSTAFCRENLAHFKCPKTVVFGDLPKTSTGKIQKFELRKVAGEV